MYRLFCMASKNNFPPAYLVEHFSCTFYSVVKYFFISIHWDSNRTVKGVVKVLFLFRAVLLSWNTLSTTVLKFCNSHPSLPLETLLWFLINTGSPLSFAFGLSLTATSPSFHFLNANFYIWWYSSTCWRSWRSRLVVLILEQNICLHRSIKLHDAGRRFWLVV